MFNFRIKYLFLVLFLMSLMFMTYGCSSKPSQKEMIDIIANINGAYGTPLDQLNGRNVHASNFLIKKFDITNDFNKKINGDDWYFIEVNYSMTYMRDNPKSFYQPRVIKDYSGNILYQEESLPPDQLRLQYSLKQDQAHYRFVKRGNEWFGEPGW